jgi:hypothetical protein
VILFEFLKVWYFGLKSLLNLEETVTASFQPENFLLAVFLNSPGLAGVIVEGIVNLEKLSIDF